MNEPRTESDPMSSTPAATPPREAWSPLRRLSFRFGLFYFVLYVLEESLGFLAQFATQVVNGVSPEPGEPGSTSDAASLFARLFRASAWISERWDVAVRWTGEHVTFLHANVTTGPNGSGDTTWNYVQVALIAVFALTGCAIWTLIAEPLGWRRHPILASVGRLWCRYYLVFFMMVYGFVKVIKTQFPFPSLMRLTERYGDSSPMGILWAMMGYSTPFNMFAGGGEVLAGALLAFRRTTALGALVGIAVMANVAAMNFCFDVPVKLFSSHLLLFCIALLLPDASRLVNLFLLNRPTAPARLARPAWWRAAIEIAVLGVIVWMNVQNGLESRKRFGDAAEKPPLYGLYDVTDLVKDGKPVPLLVTDAECWRQVIVESGFGAARFAARRMNESLEMYEMTIDAEARTVTLKSFGEKAASFELKYEEPGPGQLVLEGTLGGQALAVKLKRRDVDQFLLVSRGYHWINEFPFNR